MVKLSKMNRIGSEIKSIDRNHVAIVTSYFLPSHGGIENHIYGLTKTLVKHDWTVDVLSASQFGLPDFIGTKVHIKYTRSYLNPMNNPIVPRISRSILESPASIIHAHGLYQFTSLMAKISAALMKKPVLLTMHGIADYKGLTRTIQRTYESLILKWQPAINHFIALTQADKAFLESKGIDKNSISIVPNAIDTSYWYRDSDFVDDNKKTDILFVGSLIKRKRPSFLIDVFNSYLKAYPDSRLFIVGDGPEREKLQKSIEMKNLQKNVRLLGRISDFELRRLYSTSKMLILPSIAEGLPTVLLEAMACGLVVVASDLPGIRYFLQHGKNGFMFISGDGSSLLDVMLEISSSPQIHLNGISSNAISYVNENFSWDIVTTQIIQLYEQVIHEYY